MTFFQLIKEGKDILQKAGCENAEFDSTQLFGFATGLSKTQIVLNHSKNTDAGTQKKFFELIDKRKNGEPLQYIIGAWSFLGFDFFVGRGVLIPRRETETLVELALSHLNEQKKENPVIYDLCAGTGCIGLSLAKLLPSSEVFLLEIYDDALFYLNKNNDSLALKNTKILKNNIFDGPNALNLPRPDLIISNPPYVESGQISNLQKELEYEPLAALDGGEDGLDFYRSLSKDWFPILKEDGFMAMECGESQADEICKIFNSEKFVRCDVYTDLSKIDRFVFANKYA